MSGLETKTDCYPNNISRSRLVSSLMQFLKKKKGKMFSVSQILTHKFLIPASNSVVAVSVNNLGL